MDCPACGTANDPGRKFCIECGTKLVAACPACGTPVVPGAKFCGECGTALGVDAAPAGVRPPAGVLSAGASDGDAPTATERRIVSILFADLVGFTALADGRDPESVRELQDRYFETARAVLGRYGGTIEKFIGDAVMAVWGAPTTHEDDAERAVRAASELLSAVGALATDDDQTHLVARAAVMTGEAAVAVGALHQGLVSGDLVNTASRLQSAAPPGVVLVDDATHRATAESIAVESAGELELRGIGRPVRAWRALHAVGLVRGRRRSDAMEPPFVGRDAELRLLKDFLHAADDERRARLVSVTGIAGIGKTRLAWELEKYIDGLAGDVYWHQGRSPAYGEGITFWALAEMVRGRAGIAETDDAAVARERVLQMLAEFVEDDDERGSLAPHLLALLGLDDAPEGRRELAFAAWRRLFERIAERALVVLVFEDLQWADSGLVDFIESILEWSRSHRILVVTLARPELLERRPTWGAGQRNFTALHLEPVADSAIRQMLDAVAPGLPDRLARRIVDRAAGVPLFAVETLRMLIDDGKLVADGGGFRLDGEIADLAIPQSLRGLIGSRIDALPGPDRALLQDAAVLGQSFTLDALGALTGQSPEELAGGLGGLVQREILSVDDDPRSPERGQYVFIQGVIREVAYETLAKRERRSRHLAAARYFESLGTDDLAGILASHYLDAYRATPAGQEADALGAQARVALLAAADRASALGSYELALGHLEQALTVTKDPGDRARTWERASDAAHKAGRLDDSERLARTALDWYRERQDAIGAARAAIPLANTFQQLGRTREAIAMLEPIVAELDALPTEPQGVRVLAEFGRALMIAQDERALEVADRALAAAEQLELTPVIVEALITKAAALDTIGRRIEGIALTKGALEIASSNGLISTELRGRGNLSGMLWLEDPGGALHIALEARELARSIGDRSQFTWSTMHALSTVLIAGSWDEALALVEDLDEDNPTGLDPEIVYSTRATVAAFAGQAEVAAAQHAAYRAAAVETTRAEFQASRLIDEATHAMLSGRLDEAYGHALAAARLVPYISYAEPSVRYALWLGDVERVHVAADLLHASVERGRFAGAIRRGLEAGVAAIEGRLDEATAGYRAAAATLRDLDVPLELGLFLLDYATLIGPDNAGARAAAAEAREIFTRLGSPPLLARLDAALANWGGVGPARTPPVPERSVADVFADA